MIGNLAGLGVVYYNPEAIANILPLVEVAKIRRFIYNSGVANVFRLTGGNRSVIHFIQSHGDFFYWDTSVRVNDELVLENTAQDNEKRCKTEEEDYKIGKYA